ncbi:MAG: SDR family NAD(P)-dependent oxidoreductase [Acaryochloris sp. RU_4_1]|nr:SDR family NAD(P)-dependent oxidoreductase [Acaryochloris sp. RU_4_1]NJR53711.1 SDR family NAD(P)-dependent oxidoreductase [Acaryochloris sp. CRU_2_0]
MSYGQQATAIAIIGMAGRFPGAKNLTEFWDNLQAGVESITFFGDAAAPSADAPFLNHPNAVKAGGSLAEIEYFDATFFGFSPRDAEIIDPQQRFFLEVAWEALEQAGYTAETGGAVGVFGGSSVNTYFLHNLYANRDLIQTVGVDQIRIANRPDNLTTRTSYKLNLQGPSVSIQTSCSTSLVAVHLACQSLLNGECDLALAGGASISHSAQTGYLYQEGGILSPDGHCRAFDAQAQGTVNGNGVGIVVLKRWEAAIADQDTIHAIIQGSAINNDGSSKVGYTAPSTTGQAAVITEALAVAGVKPDSIQYIEAHGTGTKLGDPIEIAALTQAFRLDTTRTGFCGIGSVKTNLGHLDTAAGIAGLIKTVLALKHQQIPPSLHFQASNPQIDFESSPFYVNAQCTAWKTPPNQPRRAGVSSFGIGGTNAHVIVEEAPVISAVPSHRPHQILLLSAKTPTALEQATHNLADHLNHHPELSLADVAYTLQVGRSAFEHRCIVVCEDLRDAAQALKTLDLQRVISQQQERSDRPVAFLFPGQGAQYVQMGRGLYESEPFFRQQIDECCTKLIPLLGLDLRTILYPESSGESHALQQTALTQPALFVVEYALAQLWMAWGVKPSALMGHSIGEYVAACLAGVFSLEDALTLVARRGQLMQQMPAGAMLAVPLSESEVLPWLNGEVAMTDRRPLAIATVNSPTLCVVSGSTAAIDELAQKLSKQRIEGLHLHTSHGFHSPMMEPILLPFTEAVQKITLHPSQIPFLSNVTGTWIRTEEAMDPNYWVTHLRQTVRLSDAIATLQEDPQLILLEVGPGKTLSTLAQQQPQAQSIQLSSLPHPRDPQPDTAYLLQTLGQLWLQGVPIQWSAYSEPKRRRIPLPTYPFERQKYWIDPPATDRSEPEGSSLKKPDIADWFYVPTWKQVPLLAGSLPLKAQSGRWLVFLDDADLGQSFVQQLSRDNQEVITVGVGEQFEQRGDRTYLLNPQQPEDYNTLLKILVKNGQMPTAIAHFWSLTSSSGSSDDQIGFYSLLFLAQALGQQTLAEPIPLLAVTNQLYDITDTETLRPEKATVLGPCKVINQEYPQLTCQVVDVMLPETEGDRDRLVEQLLTECANAEIQGMSQTASHPQWVAYRGRHRWKQTFDSIRLETADSEKNRHLRLGGVYLITGGLGGMGLTLADCLAQTVQAKLILVSRSSASPQVEQRIQGWEKQGAEVMVLQADVGDRTQMQAVKTQILERFGTLHGIIHTAGVAGGGMMQLKTRAAVEQVLVPKVQGTLVLASLFQELPLDFWVLCSSLSSLLGGFGQVDYCAANAVLDCFAHHNALTHPIVAINWGTWQQVGMAVKTSVPEVLAQRRAASLQAGILPEEGVEAFHRILQSGLPQVVVSTQDFQYKQVQAGSFQSLAATLTPPTISQIHIQNPNPEPATHTHVKRDYHAPHTHLEQTLAEIWQQLLGIEPIGIHDNFFTLGGHSLLATQVTSHMRKTLQIELPLQSLFDYPTIAQLAQIIEDLLLKEIESLTEDEARRLLQNV